MSYKIYLIKHLDTDMKYVGITGNDLITRWEQHRHSADSAVYTALRTEGYRMTMELLEEVDTKHKALELEQEYIRSLGTATPNGYNRQVRMPKITKKETRYITTSNANKMIANGKQRSLISRKNDWKDWKYDSTIIYGNCELDFSNVESYRQVIFNDDKNTQRGIWCRAPRPHELDYQFEVAMTDWYYLVSWNCYHFNPFKDKRWHPISYTVHRATWTDNTKDIQAWQYLGTYLTEKCMDDFVNLVDAENYIIQSMRDYQKIITFKVTNSMFGKYREVAYEPR